MSKKIFYYDSNDQPLPYSEVYDMREEMESAAIEESERLKEDSFLTAEENN